MDKRNFSSSDYRFGFNGQEKDDEIYGSEGTSYTAEFWQYDTRLARRWNVDPVVKEHESPYACFANNPLYLIDPSGADTAFADNNTKNQFNMVYNQVNSQINTASEEINELIKQWSDSDYKDDKIKDRITAINQERSELLEIKAVFDAVIQSEEKFYYRAKDNPDGHTAGGGIHWSNNENRFNISFYTGNLHTIVHETTHGEQYTSGKLIKGRTRLYDYMDEYEAFNNAQNYNHIFFGKDVMSENDLRSAIESKYRTKVQIPQWNQYCKP
jgi:RHS repeat-associated protein